MNQEEMTVEEFVERCEKLSGAPDRYFEIDEFKEGQMVTHNFHKCAASRGYAMEEGVLLIILAKHEQEEAELLHLQPLDGSKEPIWRHAFEYVPLTDVPTSMP